MSEVGASWPGEYEASVGVDWGVYIEFDVDDSIIESIGIGSAYVEELMDRESYVSGWQRFSVHEILSRHGIPTRVLVYHPFQFDRAGGPSFHLLVFYEQDGFVIEYTGRAEQLNGGRYRACPSLNNIGSIELFLYQPEQFDETDAIVERVLPSEGISHIGPPDTAYERINWEQATGTSLQSFFDAYSLPDAEPCFEFSAG